LSINLGHDNGVISSAGHIFAHVRHYRIGRANVLLDWLMSCSMHTHHILLLQDK